MPPPAVASTRICAISCWSFSCICCAWRIICCMLPGSFTSLLLEISNFAYFAAEDFTKPPDLGIGERPAGGLVLSRCGGSRIDRRGGRVANHHPDAHGTRRNALQGLLQV